MTASRERELDITLASWFASEARADGAAALLEATLEATARQRPRPAWFAAADAARPARLLPLGDRTRSRVGYALVVAALLAAAVLAALLLVGRQPPPAIPLGCVGDPPNLCGFDGGTWSSAKFMPGLAVTLPGEGWYTRDLPDRLEFRHLPMTSALTIWRDPLPARDAAVPDPAQTGTIEGLTEYLALQPVVTVDASRPHVTSRGLPLASFRLMTVARPAIGLLRMASDSAGHVAIEANHYAQRLYLMGTRDGHVLSALVVAFDSRQSTLDQFDESAWPILNSLETP
jgi:hypothetical protein